MRKIVNYCILKSGSIEGLEEVVLDYIKKQWQPLGGLSVDNFGFYQAMVVYGSKSTTKENKPTGPGVSNVDPSDEV